MVLSNSMDKVKAEAIEYVKNHEKEIIKKFADPEVFISSERPFTLFMAGSPGAGKTEFSKSYIKELQNKNPEITIVRIDADEIRDLLPQYKGNNAHVVQHACGLAVGKIFDYVQKHKQNAIVDGTFSDYDISCKDVHRALDRGRDVDIYYIYQDPLIAWDFTKKREKIEGRHVSKEMFIESFFAAKENVNRVKAELGSAVELYLVIKDLSNSLLKSHFNIEKVDYYLPKEYTKEELERLL